MVKVNTCGIFFYIKLRTFSQPYLKGMIVKWAKLLLILGEFFISENCINKTKQKRPANQPGTAARRLKFEA